MMAATSGTQFCGMQQLHPPPKSTNTVKVRMIDTTCVLKLYAEAFLKPVMPGHEIMTVTDVCFLIENPRLGKKAMFDLGVRKDYWNSPPWTIARIEAAIPGVKIDKDVTEILQEKGMKLDEIDDIIWSHSHWDHTGSPYLFPPSTNLCYGKGTGPFPGYPTNPNSALNEADFKGRKSIELDYEMQIGPYPAHDFYGDGSLYLLDTPGHWPGHICALARTTPDTFLFLGGDICHFAGDFRPSEQVPLPNQVPEAAFGNLIAGEEALKRSQKYPTPCPCSFFSDHHPQNSGLEGTDATKHPSGTPFYKLSTHKHSSYKDPPLATVTTQQMQKYFDSDPNVLVCLAHDTGLLEHLPTFNTHPEKDLNDWQQQGVKEKCHWSWLGELPRYDENHKVVGPGMREKPLVEGLWKDGQKVDSLR